MNYLNYVVHIVNVQLIKERYVQKDVYTLTVKYY